jgi:hypothetical protein
LHVLFSLLHKIKERKKIAPLEFWLPFSSSFSPPFSPFHNMKVQRLHLGKSENGSPFYLYQIPSSSSSENSTNSFYQVDIIEALFFDKESRLVDYVPRQYFNSDGCYYYKTDQGNSYLLAQAIGEAAVKLNKYLLAEICKLKRQDVLTGVADTLLESVGRLTKAEKYAEDDHDMPLVPATPPYDLLPIKPEPQSPPPHQLGTPPLTGRASKRRHNNPMSVDQLVSEQAQER